MALIKCPECGKEVSDMATQCPVCGYPIANEISKGKIKIKLGMFNCAKEINGGGILNSVIAAKATQNSQNVTITSEDKTLWSGKSGQIAQIDIQESTRIKINYAMDALHWGGSCEATIDPEEGNKYVVNVQRGILSLVLIFQATDIIDID